MKMKTIVSIILVILLLIIFWQFSFVSNAISGGLLYLTAPLWGIEKRINTQIEKYGSIIKTKQSILLENKNLSERINKMEAGLIMKNILLQENMELKEMLGRGGAREDTLLVVVLSKPNRSPYDTLILDVGKKNGVSVGNKVIAYGDIVIGIIDEVYGALSRAKLFSSPGEEVEVTVGRENIQAIARGVGGGNFEIRLPRGLDVTEGDIVSFPSISTQIVGVVEKIKVRPSDSFQVILFKSPVNLFQLKFVEILLD